MQKGQLATNSAEIKTV